MNRRSLSTRRDFLHKGLVLVGAGGTVPAFVEQSAAITTAPAAKPPDEGRVLVVLQLAGGNDGLNTIVPYRNETYYKLRPTLAIPKKDILPLDDELGLHPAAVGLKRLYDQGMLCIVQGVGYPNPNRSHLRSMDIWHKAGPDERIHDGWLGRYFECTCGSDDPDPKLGMALMADPPPALRGDRFEPAAFTLPGLQQAAQANLRHAGTRYPRNPLARSLALVARLVAAGKPTRVYYVSLAGFDTHTGQANRHRSLLGVLGESLTAFVDDLKARGHLDRTLIVSFSEFGRGVKENASAGTDHGKAAPMFLIGNSVKPGLVGRHPSLEDVDNDGDLRFHTDFRSVYAAVLQNWLKADARAILGQTFKPADVLL